MKGAKNSSGDDHYTPLMKRVHDDIIGDGAVFKGPFGKRAVLYCDYTATGRPLKTIEKYIDKYVKKYYANTHTSTSFTGRQTSQFRHEAKDIIRQCVNAGPNDVIIFVGSGSTAAIHKLVGVLKSTREPASDTVVFVSIFEHHSNLLPWMEEGYEVVRIGETKSGCLNIEDLRSKLEEYKASGKRLMASLSAASNITGIVTDTVAVAELLHQYGAYSFWDFATAAPYLPIDMNATDYGYKDAVFCSPHKFIGGAETPGLLIAKKHLFHNEVPHGAGGGTVLYVIKDQHKYLPDIEEREEGGTPAIIGSIRAGLVFKLKECVGLENIDRREEYLYQHARRAWLTHDNIVLLGCGSVKRLPIFSFLIRNPESGKYLHHNFVATLLNDLFGIQSRGGCACAGPYAEELLGIDGQEYIPFLERQVSLIDTCTSKCYTPGCDGKGDKKDAHAIQIMKPGFVRLNFSYLMSEDEFQFVLDAVIMVAEQGWRLLPQYKINVGTAEWLHRQWTPLTATLAAVQFGKYGISMPKKNAIVKTSSRNTFKRIMKEARRILSAAAETAKDVNFEDDEKLEDFIHEEAKTRAWFMQPREAALLIPTSSECENKARSKSSLRKYFSPKRMSATFLRKSSTLRKSSKRKLQQSKQE